MSVADHAIRWTLEETSANPVRVAPLAGTQMEDEDWSISAITARAASAPDEVRVIAGLYHAARLTAGGVGAEYDNVQMEARSLYPEPPAEISDPAKSGYRSALLPRQDWPQWRREIFERWARQCSLIEKALGVDAAEAASKSAWRLMDELADRALAIPAKSVKDVLEKIGVVNWQVEAEVLDEGEAVKVLRIVEADLKRLDARDAA